MKLFLIHLTISIIAFTLGLIVGNDLWLEMIVTKLKLPQIEAMIFALCAKVRVRLSKLLATEKNKL